MLQPVTFNLARPDRPGSSPALREALFSFKVNNRKIITITKSQTFVLTNHGNMIVVGQQKYEYHIHLSIPTA